MPIPHHKVPSDLSSAEEPVYLGLDIFRASGLGVTVLGTLICTTSASGAVRSSVPVALWVVFLGLAFGEVDGLPAWRVASWFFLWLGDRLQHALRRKASRKAMTFRA